MKWIALFYTSWYILIPLTLLFGRFFCRYCCLLGLAQSLVGLVARPKTPVRRVCTRLPRAKAQRLVNWAVILLYFALPAFTDVSLRGVLHPWGIAGRVLSAMFFVPGIVVFCAILILAVFGKGRIWCNWICPLGTVFDLVSRVSWKKDKVVKNCNNCSACFPKAAQDKKFGAEGVERREVLHGIAALAVAEKLTDGGYADVSLPGDPDREVQIMPPGASSRRSFRMKCVGCGVCVDACPEKCIRPSVRLSGFGLPEMTFKHGHCLIDCNQKCASVCPVGAISVFEGVKKRDIHIGHAVWRKDLCIRTADGVQCTACVRKCPVKAIHIVEGFPVVDKAACIGCGACEHVCPSRPEPAIFVKGFDVPRVVRPIGEADLVDEMKRLLDEGDSVVVARNGEILVHEKDEGVAPLLRLYDERRLRSAIVACRVVGRSAAAIFAFGGARRVHAGVMSADAAELLRENDVEFSADETVEKILDRERTGICPVEQAIDGLTQRESIIEAIRKATGK
ncbi:MAG: DUF1893 domain-containing protein [Kiritimatiellae bacterium]|nr:DUF1893 domain-containing protein [Kiritimatiellia bacterium]